MLTDAQIDVVIALNDLCELHGRVTLAASSPLPELLADLERPVDEVLQAATDLHALGLIEGSTVAEFNYPVLVTGVTAIGRQELPSG